jgi:hypothetical protein
VLPPDLGSFTSADALTAALRASGPLDNESDASVRQGTAPGLSICVPILRHNEPGAGTVIHEALAGLGADRGVVLVLRRPDGAEEARLYSTGEADPVTGGCRLLIKQEL